jgi:hypothetical protein
MEYIDILSQGLTVVFTAVRVKQLRDDTMLFPYFIINYEVRGGSLA